MNQTISRITEDDVVAFFQDVGMLGDDSVAWNVQDKGTGLRLQQRPYDDGKPDIYFPCCYDFY